MIEVLLQYGEDVAPRSERPGEECFRAWGEAITEITARVGVRISSNEESARLNQTYRKKSGPTNVLSFPFDARQHTAEAAYLGDIVLAEALIAAEAVAQGKPLPQHWAHLFIHGVLHLQGYRHDDEAQASAMEGCEIGIMRRLGFPNPYQLPVAEKP